MTNKRVWQNLRAQLSPNPYRQYFNDANRRRLSQEIIKAEQGHRGEIRLVVESQLALSLVRAGTTARQRAIHWFSELHVWDTEENSGILIYILLAERKIEIVADRGINRLVGQDQWNTICVQLQSELAAAHVIEGLSQALSACAQLLRQHFPIASDAENPDELSNELIFIP
ncbi:TPM domain-containing protein [Undibacterium macrobrachii]|jgi:hypothetical protein|uniref:TPM domain-containing protein n=1 Tax=Undibacterium macrobrachii TaxID=1119058 RepID=A0ABQ2XK17_9BURK|nr:TPM domain-containing protein [Undibacterium macrobrachii]GGX21531.1 hypothetical protein GCM10011282_29620 [Undibacterium macrobrachii]